MLTKSGVKLLDFGLAGFVPPAAGPPESPSSPPRSATNLTEKGTILGTFQYMAPEQLEGKDADARTDIFALGAVLYEMATGKKAFSGPSQATLIAAIIGSEPPPISSVQPMAPPALDRVVKTCLAKDPEDRWQTAHDVRLQLQWILEGGSQAGVAAPVVARRKNRERVAWGLFAAAALAAAFLAAGYLRRAPKPASQLRTSVLLPEKRFLNFLAISPDGGQLAFVAGIPGAKRQIWLRPLDGLSAQPLAGHGERGLPLLVARREIHRLLRRWEVEEDRSLGRTGRHPVRRGAQRPRRNVEPGGRDPLRPPVRPDQPRSGDRRRSRRP